MRIAIVITLILGCISLHSQTFGLGIMAGLNFSELEGEGIGDYYGINVGLKGTGRINDWSHLAVQLLYSVNGEYVLPLEYPDIQYGRIRLRHIEIPVLYEFSFHLDKRKDYRDIHLGGGIAYVRLFDYEAFDEFGNEVSEEVSYGDVHSYNGQVELTYFFTEKWATNFKASLPLFMEGLDWTIACRFFYRFLLSS